MKTFFIALITSAALLAGCEKKEVTENPLIGRWQLQKSFGGATGSTVILPSRLTILQVFNDAIYTIDYAQNNFVPMKYVTMAVTDVGTGSTAQGILFYDENNQPGNQQSYTISGDELIIKDNSTESYSHYYKRVE